MERITIRKYNEKRNHFIETCVDENTFVKEYKPEGWEKVGEIKPNIVLSTDEYTITETKIAEKKKVVKHFDDKLVKGE